MTHQVDRWLPLRGDVVLVEHFTGPQDVIENIVSLRPVSAPASVEAGPPEIAPRWVRVTNDFRLEIPGTASQFWFVRHPDDPVTSIQVRSDEDGSVRMKGRSDPGEGADAIQVNSLIPKHLNRLPSLSGSFIIFNLQGTVRLYPRWS